MAFEPATEDFNGTAEVVAEFDEQVDVVDVPRTGEAVGEVVARVHDGLHLTTVGALEAEAAFAPFSYGSVGTEGGDSDGRRKSLKTEPSEIPQNQTIKELSDLQSCEPDCTVSFS